MSKCPNRWSRLDKTLPAYTYQLARLQGLVREGSLKCLSRILIPRSTQGSRTIKAGTARSALNRWVEGSVDVSDEEGCRRKVNSVYVTLYVAAMCSE